MDLIFPMSKSQRLVDDLDVGVDSISNLPDEVLCHILSYIPTKHAVATSILSKRWEYLWTSIPILHFTYEFVPTRINDCINSFKIFKDYVDSVLFHNGGTTIQKCKFKCHTKYAAPYICAWVCAIVCCNVQELTLKYWSFYGHYLKYRTFQFQDLPWSLYTCKTLVVLKIDGEFVLNLPTYFCFPSLKTLHLDSVIYVDNVSVKRLFSSCPILEELVIIRRYWDGVQILCISVPSLKRLSIFSDMNEYKRLSIFSDMNEYIIADHDYKTEINAPNLEYFILNDRTSEDHSMNVSPSLVEARLHGRCTYALFKGISHVKVLALSYVAIQDHGLPTFHHLTRLKLDIGNYFDGKLLRNLLESSPNLEVLVISQQNVSPADGGRGFHGFYGVSSKCLPKCLLLHLKTLEIINFLGMSGEVRLVKYFLESAKVLDRMTIHCYQRSMRKKYEWDEDEILKSPRGSISCQLEIID